MFRNICLDFYIKTMEETGGRLQSKQGMVWKWRNYTSVQDLPALLLLSSLPLFHAAIYYKYLRLQTTSGRDYDRKQLAIQENATQRMYST
jgi:hypothetical protein